MPEISELERYICTLYDTRDQLKQHIFKRSDLAFARGDQARDEVTNLEQLKARQAEMKIAFIAAIGGLPSSNSSLNATTTKVSKGSGYIVENVIFESRPGHYVTSNLYIPEQHEEPCGAVLFLCGHEYEAKHSSYYHQVCLRFVQAGLIVMAVDPIGQGERLSFCNSDSEAALGIWGTREHQRFGVQCYALGDSVARYFIHDAMRAVDYLCERKEVDPARIGVTGNSGGGTQASMLMVCDDRISVGAPATFIMNRKHYMHAGGVQDAEQVWPGLTSAGFDHEDLLLLFAPKPLLVLAAKYDFFPIEATRRTVARCRKFWDMHGKNDDLLLLEDQSTHCYTDRLAQAASQFFVKHLSRRSLSSEYFKESLQPLSVEQLICTSSGQVLRDLPDARSIRDDNIRRCDLLEQMRASLSVERKREQALDWLKEKVIATRQLCDLNPRRVSIGQVDDLLVEYILWWSQSDLMNSGYVIRRADAEACAKQPITVGIWHGGTKCLAEHWSWIQETCSKGRSVLVLNSSGVGPHEPYPIYDKPVHHFFGVMHKLADDLIWLGDSLAAIRTYDMIRCLDVIEQLDDWQSGSVDFYTIGRQGIYAKLAAVLDARVGRSIAVDPLDSVADWVKSRHFEEEDAMSVVLPGILKYFDLHELSDWLPTASSEGERS
jgi:cephalosporin-C deacetylase-like acetyl esterase